MMFDRITAALGIALFAAPAAAQQATPAAPQRIPYGAPISLEAAEKVLAAAEAEAKKNGLAVAIAVVDSGGNLVAFHRLDNTQIGSIRIAEGKARTAIEFRRPTRVLQEAVAGGGVGLWWLRVEGIVPLEGGVPIQSDGKITGAIGVSGGLPSQDAQVAQAGADALAK
jgi:uncharacterized protein GlcG (DUF336 family)